MYIRLFIEAHETMLLSATSEVYAFELNTVAQITSFILAGVILLMSIILPGLAFYVFYQYRESFNPDKKFILMEFLADLKNAKAARIYM